MNEALHQHLRGLSDSDLKALRLEADADDSMDYPSLPLRSALYEHYRTQLVDVEIGGEIIRRWLDRTESDPEKERTGRKAFWTMFSFGVGVVLVIAYLTWRHR